MKVKFPYTPFAFDSDSIGADHIDDFAFESDFPHGVNNDEWTTEDGITYKVTEMTPSHIRNCMRMIERNTVFDDFYYVLAEELERRSRIVQKIMKSNEELEEMPF